MSIFIIPLVCVLTAGCALAQFSGDDIRLRTNGNTLYVLTRTEYVGRNLCAALGGDVARAEGRWGAEGRTFQLGRVVGCHTVRHVIVCQEQDDACIAHEERHRDE